MLKENILLNERIRAREVRTIGDEGEQLGILPLREALRIAQEKGLDLVLVAADAQPPVCKIMDYGRHKFEQEKRSREARKKQHVISLKEVTLSYKIGEHDYQVRLRAVQRFLQEGDKVKVTIRFRGREMQHQALGTERLMRFARDVADIAMIEREPRQEGKTLFIILAPKKGAALDNASKLPILKTKGKERSSAST
ncbi:MAG: translation initiation factor IF-3 [Cyanobacteria bacterium NC_groundwater_1444_Ag_S-0.65um_54_12]|nr:translation initiation factor IF-3 [Cyanobacteria bacterium NC_groundwater_1444_Ag_S-0.65um_54_12]